MPSPVVRLTVDTHEALFRLKLREAGEVGKDFPFHILIDSLIVLGEKYSAELTRLIQERL